MFKHLIISSILINFLVFPINTQAQTFQNLIPNGSFETYTQCPKGSINYAIPWTGPTINSTDYYNACSSNANVPNYCGINSSYPCFLYARDGQAYAGMQIYNSQNYREYAQVRLLDTLKNGYCYYLEFYAALAQQSVFGTNNIGANLSSVNYPSNLSFPGLLLNIPIQITNYNNTILKDTVKWNKISGIYEATGTENYIIIGNFKSDSNTDTLRIYKLGTGPVGFANVSYIFIDAVSVFSINPSGNLPWSYRDTSIIRGDSVYIGNKMGGQNFHPKWFDINGNYLATNAGIYVRPLATSSYIVQYTICGVPRKDTVEVKVLLDVGLNNLIELAPQLTIYPQPANDELILEFTNIKLHQDCFKLFITNNLGQTIKEENIKFIQNKNSINIKDLSEGVYLLNLKSNNTETISKRFVITR